MSFANKTVLITGASSGIGEALTRALAKQGARVGITARRTDLLEQLAQQVRSAGGTIAFRTADVADSPALHQALTSLSEELGPPDMLIANAGVGLPSELGPRHVEMVELMTRVNFLGVVNAFDAVVAGMRSRGRGHLVAISSLAAFKGLPGSAGYCASKAAVNAYCESIRIELNGTGVAVTCVCPGFIDTAMTKSNPRPMPLLKTPDQAAEAILRALRRKPGVFSFPKPMRWLMTAARWAPDRFIAKRVPIGVASTDPPAPTSGQPT